MSSEHTFEDKGKAKPKPAQEAAEAAKDGGSLTASDLSGKLDASTLTNMQKTVGNAAVQRFLAQRQGSGPAEIQEETASAINSKRGGGSSLDSQMASKAGEAMGQDFSGVNVHTDSQADELSRDLGAKAFTTGNDIFFQSGAYNPGSGDGQRLIAHELTHVVQQGASAPSGGSMTVNDPNDQYEAEADEIADQVMNQPDPALQRQEEQEDNLMTKPDPTLQREGEEEELAMPKLDPTIQREGEEEEVAMPKLDPTIQREGEEEEVAMPKLDPALQRQEEREDELMQKADPALQRQEEEDPLQLKADSLLQRAAPEEEVMEKADPTIQRAAPEEEVMEKVDPVLQRAEMAEDEEVMPKLDPSLQRQEDDELV